MSFPRTPTTGKNGAVYVNTGDGTAENLTAMTKQASYAYNGVTYVNRAYLLGAGKTLINMRPEKEPSITLAGIIDGLEISPGTANDTAVISDGSLVDDNGTVVACAHTSADSLAFTRPAATQGAWVAISVNKSTGAVTATKGTDTTAGTGIAALLDTWGSAAGQRPLIPVADLLVGLLAVTNGAAVLLNSEISYDDREEDNVDVEVLPNVGGALVSRALPVIHVGALSRPVKFTGYYLDNVMSLIGTAKSWTFSPSTNEVTDSTFTRNIAITEIGGWSFSFEQLMTDNKVWLAVKNRQGFGAVRLVTPNAHYWQGAATMAPTFNCAVGALNNISVAGSFLEAPEEGDIT
jgi:hypothetical protein